MWRNPVALQVLLLVLCRYVGCLKLKLEEGFTRLICQTSGWTSSDSCWFYKSQSGKSLGAPLQAGAPERHLFGCDMYDVYPGGGGMASRLLDLGSQPRYEGGGCCLDGLERYCFERF